MSMLATSCSTIQPQAFSTSPLQRPRLQKPPLHPTLVGRRSSSPPCHVLLLPSPFLAAAAAVGRKNSHLEIVEEEDDAWEEGVENVGGNGGEEEERRGESLLYSVAPYPLMLAAALPGAGTIRSIFGPFVELVKTWNLPDWLVHWGHPGNMAVVLFAMGGYGTYLGFRIRLSNDAEEKAMAKDLHPKLLGGMFFFFALGATGGVTALLTSGKPILESPHAVTGLIGLSLLTVQTILPSLFEENPGLRTAHGLFGSSIMTIFLIHAALGLQLGLSF